MASGMIDRGRVVLSGGGWLAVLFGLGACVSFGDEAASGPFYPAGYGDGCQTAQNLDGSFMVERVRDETLFETEPSYRSGWRAGNAQCAQETQLTPRPTDLGEWDPL